MSIPLFEKICEMHLGKNTRSEALQAKIGRFLILSGMSSRSILSGPMTALLSKPLKVASSIVFHFNVICLSQVAVLHIGELDQNL